MKCSILIPFACCPFTNQTCEVEHCIGSKFGKRIQNYVSIDLLLIFFFSSFPLQMYGAVVKLGLAFHDLLHIPLKKSLKNQSELTENVFVEPSAFTWESTNFILFVVVA